MAVSIIGFLISIWLIWGWSPSWGFAFAAICVIMFFASVISMSKAEPIPEHMDELAMHELSHIKEKRKKRAIENKKLP